MNITLSTEILKLIRIKHWVKNVFVFLPVFFGGKISFLFTQELVLTFLAFCSGASAIYVLNDIIDVAHDKLHQVKKFRPLASGAISISTGKILFAGLLVLFLLLLFLLQSNAVYFILSYFVLNIAYSFKLKELPIIDVSCISLGFVLRIFAGGAATDIHISHWMVIIVFLLSVSMALSKRRDDLLLDIDKNSLRKSLTGYNLQFLDFAKGISFSVTLVAYIMYSISPEVMSRVGSENLYLTSFFVFLGIMRYIQITLVENDSGSPTDILWKDRFLQFTLFGWMMLFTLLLYGNKF